MSSIKVSELTAKTSPSGSEELLINDGGTSKKITIANLPDTDTTYTASDFKLDDLATPDDNTDLDFSTTKHGLVPKGTDTGKFLKDNGTWATPTDTNTTYSNFVGDSGSGGTAGLAPAPTAGDAAAGKYLDSSGGWTVPPDTDTNTTYTSSDFTHDSLSGVTANEHIDWTTDQGATNIHAGNYTDTDTVYTHPTGDGNLHVPATSTTNDGKVLTAGSTAGSLSWAAVDGLPSQTGESGKYLTTDGSAASWATVSSNSTSSGLYEHANTISANYTIGTGNNALTAGPITINTGVSVTVPTGSTWVIA